MQDRLRELGLESENELFSKRSDTQQKKEPQFVDDFIGLKTPFMGEFLRQVEGIEDHIQEIKKNIVKVRALYTKSLHNVKEMEIKKEKKKKNNELEQLLRETNNLGGNIGRELKLIEHSLKKQKETCHDEKNLYTAEYRFENNILQYLTQKFLKTMEEYNDAQIKWKYTSKEKAFRQYKIKEQDANKTEEDFELEIEKGVQVEDTFKTQILQDPVRHQKALDALSYVENKHKDLLQLHQSLIELQNLFNEMAILVDAQTDLLQEIENNVSAAAVYTEKAVSELRSARKKQKSSRKKLFILIGIMGCVLLILIVAGGTIGGTFGN